MDNSHIDIRMKITGMTCKSCARTIARALETRPGITAVKVS